MKNKYVFMKTAGRVYILRPKGRGRQAGSRLQTAEDTWGNVDVACRRYSKEVRQEENKLLPHCMQPTSWGLGRRTRQERAHCPSMKVWVQTTSTHIKSGTREVTRHSHCTLLLPKTWL